VFFFFFWVPLVMKEGQRDEEFETTR